MNVLNPFILLRTLMDLEAVICSAYGGKANKLAGMAAWLTRMDG